MFGETSIVHKFKARRTASSPGLQNLLENVAFDTFAIVDSRLKHVSTPRNHD